MKSHFRIPFRFVAVLAMLILSGAISAFAQPRERRGDPEPRLERMMTHLTSTLKLNEEQAVKVRSILDEQLKKQQELFEARRTQDQEQRQEMRENMQRWRADTDSRVTEVLTDEQAEQYKKYMKDNRRGPRGERGMRRAPRERRR
jgi:Spy/CpxP family protein refolding chaperone